MENENVDTEQAAHEETHDEQQETQQEASADQQSQSQEQEDEQTPFTPEQAQYVGSWMGRLLKRQIDETVLPTIRQLIPQQQPQQTYQSPDADGKSAIDKFNEDLQNQIFQGDVMGAFQKIQQVQTAVQQNRARAVDAAISKSVTDLSDKPFYKEIYTEMIKTAKDAATKGMNPDLAADYAYNKAVANMTLNKGPNGKPRPTQMMANGKRQDRVQQPKLPEVFKKAAARDIAQGLFKDEADYISSLSDGIKQKYGIA